LCCKVPKIIYIFATENNFKSIKLMKKVVNACLGGRNFTLEEDAYERLGRYLDHFRARLTVPESQKAEVMEEIEGRIAELFSQEVGGSGRVVTLEMVEKVAATLGMPDGGRDENATYTYAPSSANRKLYRDPDEKKVAGVCSGLALYLDVDVTLIRVLMLVAFLCGSAGFWIYVIFWIAVPLADTPAKKCELRGLAPTAENMSRFTTYRQ
jgi:phage shock protein PspC (stress-responsive transcriptional regulator)